MQRSSSTAGRLLELFASRLRSEDLILDLMPVQWAMLRFLARGTPDRSLVEISNYTGVELVLCARAIGALQRKRLVNVTLAQSLGARRVKLTPSGKSKLLKDPVVRLEIALSDLNGREEQVLLNLLDRAIGRLSGTDAH